MHPTRFANLRSEGYWNLRERFTTGRIRIPADNQLVGELAALRYSFDLGEDADLIERAVEKVLADGKRTGDIAGPGGQAISTEAMGSALIEQLDRMAA